MFIGKECWREDGGNFWITSLFGSRRALLLGLVPVVSIL